MTENSPRLPQITPFYEYAPYWQDDDLANWSRQVKIRDGWVCTQCGELDRTLLESHHIKPKEIFPELAKDLKNGITRCLYCPAVAHWSNEPVRNKILARYAIILHLRKYPKTETPDN